MNILETVTLKPLLRWVPNLAHLCSTTNRNSLIFEKCKKCWCHYVLSLKLFFQWKVSKTYTWFDYACIRFRCISWNKIAFKMDIKLGSIVSLCKSKVSCHLKSVKCCDVIQFPYKNRFFSEKAEKSTLGPTLHIYPSATIGGVTPSLTWSCFTHMVAWLWCQESVNYSWS